MTFRSAAPDLYLYPNTLVVVKATGAEVTEWLECSAGCSIRLTRSQRHRSSTVNWDGFRTYNFDTISGINYQIDLTQPAKYDVGARQSIRRPTVSKNVTYQGKPIDPKAVFWLPPITTVLYGGKFAGTGDKHITFYLTG